MGHTQEWSGAAAFSSSRLWPTSRRRRVVVVSLVLQKLFAALTPGWLALIGREATISLIGQRGHAPSSQRRCRSGRKCRCGRGNAPGECMRRRFLATKSVIVRRAPSLGHQKRAKGVFERGVARAPVRHFREYSASLTSFVFPFSALKHLRGKVGVRLPHGIEAPRAQLLAVVAQTLRIVVGAAQVDV